MFARAVASLLPGHSGGAGAAALAWIAHVASMALLSPARRAEIIAWLPPLEHIVRKLLLAEAAALHRAERAMRTPRLEHVPLRGLAVLVKVGTLQARPAPAVAGKCAPGLSAGSHLDMARPETWRAQFSLAIPRDPRRVPDARAPRIRALWGDGITSDARGAAPEPAAGSTPRAAHTPGFRLARRFEALRRVLENPRPYAERLARALERETRRRTGIARDYLFAPCRSNGYDPTDSRLGIDAIGEAFAAPDVFDSS